MIRPSREEFIKLARGGRRVPVMREILADTETPVSAFLKIADSVGLSTCSSTSLRALPRNSRMSA